MENWNTTWQEVESANTLLIERRAFNRNVPKEGSHVWVTGKASVQVEVLDESEAGIGVLLPEDTTFELGPTVKVDYSGTRRAANVVHLTRVADGFRLGLRWTD